MPSLRGSRWPRSGPSTQKKERTCNFFTKYVQAVRAHPPDKLPAVFEPAVTLSDAPASRRFLATPHRDPSACPDQNRGRPTLLGRRGLLRFRSGRFVGLIGR